MTGRNTHKCPYCGRDLQQVEIMGHVFDATIPCDCPGAKADGMRREKEEEMQRREAEEKRLKERLSHAGIPERFWDATVDCGLYESAIDRGLYLYGGVGTAKTATASAIGVRAVREGLAVRFLKAGLIKSMLSNFDADEAVAAIKSPDLLIIDDLGMDSPSEWATAQIRLAIDVRYDTGKPVVVTANYSKPELVKRMADQAGETPAVAIVSRLSDMARRTVEFDGEDRRTA